LIATSSTRSAAQTRRRSRGGRPFDAWAARASASALEKRNAQHVTIELWNGERIELAGAAPTARLSFRSRAAFARCIIDPEVQLPECYVDGTLGIEGDLVSFIEASLRGSGDRVSLTNRFAQSLARFAPRVAWRNEQNIRHHYDLSNEFYALWLDESMTYTCAYFPEPSTSLEYAQVAKLDRVCRKLGLTAGQHVIEAGCGWGALALHMARAYGVTVTAYNLSREQIAFARARAASEGLTRRVQFVEADYRSITGRCDAFVSVGMLEHVDRSLYAELGRIVRRTLAPDGLALVHTIGRHRRLSPPRWITRRIFPGGYMPTLAEITAIMEPNDLCVLDVENLRLHYARTLEHWLARFESAADRVEALFDDRFVRMWRFYLASALAGFRSGWLQLFQVVFTGRANDSVRWKRHA
jgi:cyclopropane-fatty-acyl-phospholipid synthase